MNLISNTCLGAALYNIIGEEYENPFCWNVIDFKSICNLIRDFNTIDFNNYELKKDNMWHFSIIIDRKVIVNYVHYKFSKDCTKLTKINVDIFWNKIWEYITTKYDERLARMLKMKKNPIFIIGSIHKSHFYTEEQITDVCKLCTEKKYKLVVVNNNFDFSDRFPNVMFIKTDRSEEELNNIDFAKEIYPQIKEFINESTL